MTKALGTWGLWAAMIGVGLWAGCGGSSESTAPGAEGGAAGSAGLGGTAGVGGSGGGSAEAGPDAAQDDGALGDGADAPVTDQSSDPQQDAACLEFKDACDPNNDQCCHPMVCVTGGGGSSCRPPLDAGPDAETCLPTKADCSDPTTPCCPGLDCVTSSMGKTCRAPFDAGVDGATCLPAGMQCDTSTIQCCAGLQCLAGPGGMRCRAPDAGTWDAGQCAQDQESCGPMKACCTGLECVSEGWSQVCKSIADGAACEDLYGDCQLGTAGCCAGLTCSTDAGHPSPTCLPTVKPDPTHCPTPAPQPGQACNEIGLSCSYGMMTVCVCYGSGWLCAY